MLVLFTNSYGGQNNQNKRIPGLNRLTVRFCQYQSLWVHVYPNILKVKYHTCMNLERLSPNYFDG